MSEMFRKFSEVLLAEGSSEQTRRSRLKFISKSLSQKVYLKKFISKKFISKNLRLGLRYFNTQSTLLLEDKTTFYTETNTKAKAKAT